jgi:hypothetical protein
MSDTKKMSHTDEIKLAMEPGDSQEKVDELESQPYMMLSAEDAELARMGYKQEFKREFSWFATFSFAFSISGLLATVIPPRSAVR